VQPEAVSNAFYIMMEKSKACPLPSYPWESGAGCHFAPKNPTPTQFQIGCAACNPSRQTVRHYDRGSVNCSFARIIEGDCINGYRAAKEKDPTTSRQTPPKTISTSDCTPKRSMYKY
jgi:hypothetical protein